jgi:hypothetical protein
VIEALRTAQSLRLVAGDGPRPGVEIGMVVVDGELIVRAFRGIRSAWYQAALTHRHGRISLDGVERAVEFQPYTGPADAVSAAYRAKYGEQSWFVTSPAAQEATLLVTPPPAGAAKSASTAW